jgi:hypothetical protein
MSGVLYTIGALVSVAIVGPIYALISEKQATYGSQLEEYIVSQNPRDIADVERLTMEYDRKSKEGYL